MPSWRVLSDDGCDCELEVEMCDLPLFLRRAPGPPPWVYFRRDRRGRRTYVRARADEMLTGRNV